MCVCVKIDTVLMGVLHFCLKYVLKSPHIHWERILMFLLLDPVLNCIKHTFGAQKKHMHATKYTFSYWDQIQYIETNSSKHTHT